MLRSGATLRTSIGVGTGDTPLLTGVSVGNADTTITRASDGDINIGSNIGSNIVYRAGGTTVPVTDGGTGLDTVAAGSLLVGAGTSTLAPVALGSGITLNAAGDEIEIDLSTLTSTIVPTGTPDDNYVIIAAVDDMGTVTGYDWGPFPTSVSSDLGITSSATQTTITNTNGANVTIPRATTTTAGVMAKDDKTKLDGIATGANVNITHATTLGVTAGICTGGVGTNRSACVTAGGAWTPATLDVTAGGTAQVSINIEALLTNLTIDDLG